jgi:flagellar basal-body rod modification protein FlgD
MTAFLAPTSGSASSAAAQLSSQTLSAEETADRFLTLLVAQMQNQDPLNPMDNAELTTQMAQINTVTGIENLHDTVRSMTAQMVQMQALQGASLVGRDVTVQGDELAVEAGTAFGGFELAAPADRVKVEILSAAGAVIQTLELGAMSSGAGGFTTPAPAWNEDQGLRFRVTATSGAAVVPSVPLMRDSVEAVSLVGDRLVLELAKSGAIDYANVRAVN